ncbi:class I SAM-dependent methyltransferase [Candidatus Woesearchaeota archaeon]|nr:class I SAM-dependent methyltransferase [Candidatus Woesearchaeota archaeon]
MTHYYDKKQTSPLQFKTINTKACNLELEFIIASGVFSNRRLDKGSEVLIKYCKPTGKTLDLGCGWGAVGIYTKKLYPKIELFMSDVNQRAILLSKQNIKKHKLKAIIMLSDGFAKIKEQDFDTILLNPPQTAGKKLCIKLFEQSYKHLKKSGTLQVVARHQKGGKTLSAEMQRIFDNLEVLGKGSGFRVYKSTK